MKECISVVRVGVLLAVAATCVLTGVRRPVKADGEAPRRQADGTSVTKRLDALLRDPRCVRLDVSAFEGAVARQGTVLTALDDEEPLHKEGVFWIEAVRGMVGPYLGLTQMSFGGRAFTRVVTKPPLPERVERYGDAALAVLLEHLADWVALGPLPEPSVAGPSSNGSLVYRWQRLDGSGYPWAWVQIEVRAWDGLVTSVFEFAGTKREHPTGITADEARTRAVEYAKQGAEQNGISEIVATSAEHASRPSEPHDVIEVQVKGKRRGDGAAAGVTVVLARATGALREPVWWSVASVGGALFEDRQAVWLGDCLGFVSTRTLGEFPDWARFPAQGMLSEAGGSPRYLSADMGAEAIRLGANPAGHVLTTTRRGVESSGSAYALALDNGRWYQTANGERGGDHPAPDPSGQWVVSEWSGLNRQSALFLSALRQPGEAISVRRQVALDGEEHLPAFSADGHWLYYVSAARRGASLSRLPAELVQRTTLVKVPADQVEVIADIPTWVTRLSVFPDGQRVLLQADKGMWAASVVAKECKELQFAPLVDPDLAVPVTDLIDAWAGPGNDRVTFSGKTVDGDKVVRRRIYSCRFDGSDLQAHTPKDNQPVPMYVFPETGKTALELAKEWALTEVQFERRRKAKEGER